MQTRSLFLPLCTLALAAGYGVSQDQQQNTLEERVRVLEERLTDVEYYLQDQAYGSEQLGFAIEDAVAAGFTWGENWGSREILVKAWKAQIKTATRILPGPQPVEAVHVDPRVRRRQEIERLKELRRQREREIEERKGGDGR